MNETGAGRHSAYVIVGLLFCAAMVTQAAPGEVHLIDPGTWTKQPVSPAAMNKRMEMTALEYRAYAPIPRVGFIDIAYPADAQEYRKLGGYGVLLVVAFSQDRTELPPKRLYAMVRGREVDLDLVTSASSTQDPDTAAGIVFGAHGWEWLYSFPVYLSKKAQELRMDFAAHRDGFTLSKFSGDEGDDLDFLPVRKPKASGPSGSALTDFVKREFPGFVGR